MGRDGGRSSIHREFLMLAAAAVDGRIDRDSAAALDAHIAGCEQCGAEYAAMLADHAWLAEPAAAFPPRPEVRALILEAARSPGVPRTSDAPRRPWLALAAASLVVAVAVGAVALFGRTVAPVGGPPGDSETGRPGATSSAGAAAPSSTPVPLATTVVLAQCAPPPAGLTAWWTGDDTRDVIGGREATLHGAASFTPGLVGNALTLDGITAFAELPHDPTLDLGTGDFTIMLWVRYANVSGEQVLIEQWREATPTVPQAAGWTLTKLIDQVLLFTGESAGNGQGGSTPTLGLLPRVWYHVAVTRSGTEISVFVNGTEVGAGSAPVPVDLSLDTPLLFGRRGDNRGFLLDGQLDEVQMVIGRALFATDIRAAYLAGSNGTCAG